LAKVLEGADVAVNCVAGSEAILLASTEALCAAARQAGVRRIVHLSSMAVYGSATGVVTETSPLSAPANGYGMAKRACEDRIAAYRDAGGDAVVLRPSCVHGPGSEQWTGRIARLLRAGRIGDLGPAGDGTCNLIYIDDLAAAIIRCCTDPSAGGETFNVSDTELLTWNQFLVRFARALGATPVRRLTGRRLTLEAKLAAPALRVLQIATRSIGAGARFVPDPVTPSLFQLWRQEIELDATKLVTGLGVRFTPVEHAIATAARWANGMLSDGKVAGRKPLGLQSS
jgi:nucleoside-diphosphate-sugar epimerase